VKIIFLNIWQGHYWDKLRNFIRNQSDSTNAFCFQEVSPPLFSELEKILPQHLGVYTTENKVDSLGFVYGEAIFAENNLEVLSCGRTDLFRQMKNDMGYLQVANVKVGSKTLFLSNVHGKARPGTKLDTPVRLRQSRKIINHFSRFDGPKIIGGDFNLLPQTQSIKMFAEAGYRDLIKDFGIKCTRSQLAWKNLKKGEEKQYFADYVFVSSDIKVMSFKVPDIEVSDHLPLILDLEF